MRLLVDVVTFMLCLCFELVVVRYLDCGMRIVWGLSCGLGTCCDFVGCCGGASG